MVVANDDRTNHGENWNLAGQSRERADTPTFLRWKWY